MLVLHTFGPAFGLPDPSQFVLKSLIQLGMTGLPFRTDSAPAHFRKAPKGKLPVLVDGNTVVPDSTFIRWHLETTRGLDLDAGLDEAARGHAWAIEKFCEDHVYWISVHYRWLEDPGWELVKKAFFGGIPAPVRPLVTGMVRRDVRRRAWGHGFGRHTADEKARLARATAEALDRIVGEGPYVFGDRPTAVDAVVCAAVMSGAAEAFDHPWRRALADRPKLLAHRDRIAARYLDGR